MIMIPTYTYVCIARNGILQVIYCVLFMCVLEHKEHNRKETTIERC